MRGAVRSYFKTPSMTRRTTMATTAGMCRSTAGTSPTTCRSTSPSRAASRSITPTTARRSTPPPSYWYLAPGGGDPYRPVPLSERVGYWGAVQTFKVNGAIEGEKLKILSQDRRQSPGAGHDRLSWPMEQRRASLVGGGQAGRQT